MLTNADMTLYHKVHNVETGLDTWVRSMYFCVNWYAQRAVSTGADGLNTADILTVQIPETSAPSGFPAAVGDILVKGCGPDSLVNLSQIRGYEHYVVTAVRDCRYGSPRMRHWQLEGA